MQASKLIEDTLEITDINRQGKVFEKGRFISLSLFKHNPVLVSRITGETKVNKLKIELDINTDIYPVYNDE